MKSKYKVVKVEPLVVRGVVENNLKGVDLDIHHNIIAAVTGPSGSGKSSLAFDTIYAEGQRRYLETFSPYIRQFLARHKKPALQDIQNVRPTIAIQQRTRIRSSRSTVGSLTHLNELLRVVWVQIASPRCPLCAVPLEQWQAESLARHVSRLLDLRSTSYFVIGFSLKVSRDNVRSEIDRLHTLGYERLICKNTGRYIDGDEVVERITRNLADHEYIVALSRFRREDYDVASLIDAVNQAFKLGQGICSIVEIDPTRRRLGRFMPTDFNSEQPTFSSLSAGIVHTFTQNPECPSGKVKVVAPRPALFSFNHPLGACTECNGFGATLSIDLNKCIPDPNLSLAEGAIICWTTQSTENEKTELLAFCKKENIPNDLPWSQLSEGDKTKILTSKTKKYWGLIPWFDWLETKKYKMHVRVYLSRYRKQEVCASCNGKRLKADGLSYEVDGLTIADLWQMPVAKLLQWILDKRRTMSRLQNIPRSVEEVIKEIVDRLQCLVDLGLPYLTLERPARTLSGGETQRVNLANALGSSLVSTHFILDEPSVGLHARDSQVLAGKIRQLQAVGNSVLLVEHDEELIRSADTIIEIGPGAGKKGGEVVYNGPSAEWHRTLRATLFPHRPEFREWLTIKNASAHNVKNLSARLPLNSLVCLTGVSGSGKSTVLHQIINNGISAESGEIILPPSVSDCSLVDQTPLVKSPRANIATYTKIWENLRKRLSDAATQQGREINPSKFSFNVAGGRCENCKGVGVLVEDMQFLSEVVVVCDLCQGARFKQEILEIAYLDRNVSQWLATTVDEALQLLESDRSTSDALITLSKLGLGHLSLGHPLSELSGGEAQRLKLVPYLASSGNQSTLLLFDEPTTGLHYEDVLDLIRVFRELIEKGNSVICIAHDLTLMAHSDWICDLGPEGGEGGGEIVDQGYPIDVAERKLCHTGRELSRLIAAPNLPKKNTRSKTKSLPTKPIEQVISIRGAREHNLKNLDLDIPHGEFVCLTGVSGSGKSTIAFNIIHAESQHHFLSCVSPYARQFIHSLTRPDVDNVSGLQPTISIAQHSFQPSELSTVGTLSDIYHYIRLLYAKCADRFCHKHPEQKIGGTSAEEVVQRVLNRKGADKVRILAPIIRSKKGAHLAVLQRALDLDISEVRVNGTYSTPAAQMGNLEARKVHSIEFVCFQGVPKRVDPELITQTAAEALALGGGEIIVDYGDSEERFNISLNCPVCGKGYAKLDPEDFSFNSVRGQCPTCKGVGKSASGNVCKSCNGSRLKKDVLFSRIVTVPIAELVNLPLTQLKDRLLSFVASDRLAALASPLLGELHQRIECLIELGLGYLALNRDGRSLSGGELQRVRLATALGSPLAGVMYIFDEPSIGLHPSDNLRVLNKLTSLRDRGNTVIMIEHDPDSILSADRIVEIGPGGGSRGGNLLFSGTPTKFIARPTTPTAVAICSSSLEIQPRQRSDGGTITISNASANNLKGCTVEVPLQRVVTVCGVSGSGKSSLVKNVLFHTLTEGVRTDDCYTSSVGRVKVSSELARVAFIDQTPIGKNSRSTPISYLGIWDPIRKLFAQTLQAKELGWSASEFSYNSGNGRCLECKGLGEIVMERSFLPEARIECSECGGTRYREEVREVKFRDISINDVLSLTFDEAKSIFVNHKNIAPAINCACDLGLGYLTLGQPAPYLSGGESQRLKLVAELSKRSCEGVVFILDEPTTGLHLSDISRLMVALHRLVDKGASVIVVEHEKGVLAKSDYLIEIGPGPSELGGQIVYTGGPEGLAASPSPWGTLFRKYGDQHAPPRAIVT